MCVGVCICIPQIRITFLFLLLFICQYTNGGSSSSYNRFEDFKRHIDIESLGEQTREFKNPKNN